MKRLLDRRVHEKTSRVRKVRCFKHRRSRSLHKLTHDYHGRHARRNAAWKRERRRHRGNKPEPGKGVTSTQLGSLLALDFSKAELMAAVTYTPEPYKHFYDDHSPFKFRENE
jgi:hypothetical protein